MLARAYWVYREQSVASIQHLIRIINTLNLDFEVEETEARRELRSGNRTLPSDNTARRGREDGGGRVLGRGRRGRGCGAQLASGTAAIEWP